jgi:Arc/MetJ family transcription regulator
MGPFPKFGNGPGTTLASNSALRTLHITRCTALRTNIVLDDELVREAFEHCSNAKTKRGLVDQALRGFVANRRRRGVRELRGKGLIRPDYDYKALREGR